MSIGWFGSLRSAAGATAPSAEELPGEDAGVVAVVPAEVQAVAAGELGSFDPELLGGPGRCRPRRSTGHPGVAALGAGAAGPQLGKAVVAGVPVGPDQGQ